MERVDADRKHSNKLSTQPPQYRGYIVDLLDRLTAVLGLEYRLYPVQDGTFGYRQSSGTWDGMIGELLNKVDVVRVGMGGGGLQVKTWLVRPTSVFKRSEQRE